MIESQAKQEALEKARLDTEFEDKLVEHVTEKSVTFADGFGISTPNELGGRAFEVGDTVRLFGRGLGYIVRGIGRVQDGVLVDLHRYQTTEEAEAAWKASQEARAREERERWEAAKDETAARIKALPQPFRERLELFMRDPAWGAKFGFYELFCCEEAVEIARVFPTAAAIEAFAAMSVDEQRAAAPKVRLDQHSGNTFGMSARLAWHFVSNQENVMREHGGVCVIVGCAAFGCWSTTLEKNAPDAPDSEAAAPPDEDGSP